jgi:hypothetical protein
VPESHVDPARQRTIFQPFFHRFFIKYAIAFCSARTPAPIWAPTGCIIFLETDDEYFNYDLSPVPGQGRWYVYGLYLPDDVLQKVYYQNAERVVLGLKGDQ